MTNTTTCARRLQVFVTLAVSIQVLLGLWYLSLPKTWLWAVPQQVRTPRHQRVFTEPEVAEIVVVKKAIELVVVQPVIKPKPKLQPAKPAQISRKWPIPNITGQIPPEVTRLSPHTDCSACPVKQVRGNMCLKTDTNIYFKKVFNDTACLVDGTDWTITSEASTVCHCKPRWHGPHCSIPESVMYSDMPKTFIDSLKIRQVPRRIILGFAFNIEFSLLEIRAAEMGDLVDAFVIQESNFTAYGEPKALRLLKYLQGPHNLTEDILCKIVYVFLDYFPKEAYYNGWIIDELQKAYVGSQGIKNQVKNLKHDDIVILADADEVQARETLLFLKLHDGYPESFGYNYRWTVYGFFWSAGRNRVTRLCAGMTVGMLSHVIGYKKFGELRSSDQTGQRHKLDLESYIKSGGRVRSWWFGNNTHPAGWHCSWCFPPRDIRAKLLAAQNGDFPRWGDYPEKADLEYITTLVKTGSWFDDKSKMVVNNATTDRMYAPSYALENPEKFKNMLVNPYT